MRGAVAFLILATTLQAGADGLYVAREALRDGLVDVARRRAENVEGDDAKLVVVESYAREGKWGEILKSLDSWNNPQGEAFVYYKALAQAKLGMGDETRKTLDGFNFQNKALAARVPMVRARVALETGNKAEALDIAKSANFAEGDAESKMAAAEILDANGERQAAEVLWREIVKATNATERAVATAALNLGEAEALRLAYDRVEEPGLRRRVALSLGMALFRPEATFEEGEALVTATVKESPGAEGAKEAFVALADAYLERGMYQKSADAFREAMEAWREASRDFRVQEGRGWALRRLGKYQEALESFSKAEEAATNDVDRATAALEQGDVLAECSRGDESMSKYRQVLEKYPDTPSGVKLKSVVELREKESEGRELYRNFKFKEAQALFSEIAKKDPSRKPRMDYLEMLCLYGQVRDADAARKAKDLAAGCPDPAIKAEAALWLAKFFYNARQWADSCELFTSYATNMSPASVQAPSALLWASRAAFANNEFQKAVDLTTKLARDYPDSPEKTGGSLVQGEALVELSRLDEAIVVLEGAVADAKTSAEDRVRAKTLKADALFVMGADNASRYKEALDDYRSMLLGESLSTEAGLELSFKIARTLEKLGRVDEAIDQYYGEGVCAYRDARAAGRHLGDGARATFAKAAFRLADEFESRGAPDKAAKILSLVQNSDAGPAAKEARRRLKRIKKKGGLE